MADEAKQQDTLGDALPREMARVRDEVMPALERAGVTADYFEIDSAFGHQASGADWAKWAPVLGAFLEKLWTNRRSQN